MDRWDWRLTENWRALQVCRLCPASNFSLQYQLWITYKGHENKRNDRILKNILIAKQILPASSLKNVWRTVWRICTLTLGCKGLCVTNIVVDLSGSSLRYFQLGCYERGGPCDKFEGWNDIEVDGEDGNLAKEFFPFLALHTVLHTLIW